MGGWFRRRPIIASRRFILEQLEERIVLDAAVPADAQNTTDHKDQPAQAAEAAKTATPAQAAEAAAAPTQAAAQAATSTAQGDPLGKVYSQDLNVVLISNAIADVEAVSKAATPDAKVVVYDAEHDTLDSVVTKLQDVAAATGGKIGHLALFAPGGQAGALTLTTTESFTAADIQLHPGSWQVLGSLLAQDARIDLYGCNIGQGAAGQLLVTTMAEAANATVWASDNPTGNVAGADWALEAHSGESDKPMLIDPARLDGTRIFLADLVGTPGDDTLTNSDTVDNIYGYAGWDTITNTSSGTVLGVIDGGTGNDTINLYTWNNPVIHGGGNGYDTLNLYLSTLTVSGTPTSGSATDGAGHTITWDGFNAVKLMGTAGDDNVTIEAAAQVTSIRTGDGNDIITNHGFVSQIISGDAGDDTITNSGTVGLGISGDAGDDTITNSGTAGVGLSGGDGADTITNSGTVGWTLDGGLGADTITNSGTVSGDIDGDDGDDTITNTSTGTVTYIYTGDGNDTIINYGTVTNIWLIPGNNTITNYGWITDISGDTGNDTLNLHLANLTVSGTPGSGSATDGSGHTMTWDGLDIVNVMGTDGDDSVTIAAAAQVTSIQTGAGNDIITIHGIVSQDIDGGAGYDTINLYTWDNPVIHGGGDALNLCLSTLTVSGTPTSGSATDGSGHTITWDGFNSVNVMGTGGVDHVTIAAGGTVTSIQTGDGNDIIANHGIVSQDIDGGAGNDFITNSGTVIWDLDGGDGADTITNTSSGTVRHVIDGGAGSDTINLSTWNNPVIHGGGNGYDTLNLYLSTLTVSGTPTSGSATDGSGHTMTWDGVHTVRVRGTGGDDSVTIATGATVDEIATRWGNDTITNYGTVTGMIDGGDGNDIILNCGTVGLGIDGGADWDTLYLANAINISDPPLPDGSADYYSDATHFTTVTWQNFEAIDINHAPFMTGGAPSLSAIIEDVLSANNTGTAVSALVAVSGPGDADGDALGMAVIGVSSPTGGHWEYQLNATSAWQSFTGSESVSSAVLLAPTATVRFVPAPDWNGTVDPGITFKSWDQEWGHSGDVNVDLSVAGRVDGTGSVSLATETASITVTPVNDPPTVTSLPTASVSENMTGTAYTATGADPEGDPITWSLSGTDAGLFNINGTTGAVSFVTAPDYENPADANHDNIYQITVTATDTGLLTASKNVAVTVTNLNEAPSVTSLASASVPENTAGTFYTATGTDQDAGDSITWSLGGTDAGLFTINGATGAVSFNASPDYENAGDADHNNIYQITVVATSSGPLTGSKDVAITVTNVNEPPVVTSGAAASVPENTTGTIYTATGTDPDAGDSLTWSLSGTDSALFTVNATTGALGFTAAPDYETPGDSNHDNVYEITITATDTGSLTGSKNVSITVTDVNEAPVLDNSGSPTLTTIAEDDTAIAGNTVAQILATGAGGNPVTDVDAGAVEGMAVVGVDNAHGTWEHSTNGGATWINFGAVSLTTATVLADNASTSVRFVPAADWNGAVDPGITFHAWDQMGGYANGQTGVDVSTNGGTTPFSTASETADISVTAVNDAPTVVVPADQVMNEDTSIVVNGIVVQDIDAAAGTGQVQVTLSVDHGVMTLGNTAGIAFAPGDANGTAHVTFTGLIADVNAALNTLQYAPNLNYFGADTITVNVNDLGNTGVPGALHTTEKLNLTVIEQAPTGRPPSDGPTVTGLFGPFPGLGTTGPVDIGGVDGSSSISFGTGGGGPTDHHAGAGPATGEGFHGLGAKGLDFTSGTPLHHGSGGGQAWFSQTVELTGLHNYAENVLAGKMLVFNMDDIHFTDLCTDCVFPTTSRPEIPTGLAGYLEGIKAGKTLVFNLSDISCMDAICGAGG